MKCPKCSADAVSQSLFCHKCGARLELAPASDDPSSDSPSGEPRPMAGPADRFRDAATPRSTVAEEELWQGTYNVKAMAVPVALSLVATVGLIVVGFYFWNPGVWWGVLAAVVVLWLYQLVVLAQRRLGVRYRLTTHRFFHESGILMHTTDLIEVIDIDDVTYRQNLIDRMLGVGSICIVSSDRSHPDLKIPGIDDVRAVAALLQDARHAERTRRGVHIESI